MNDLDDNFESEEFTAYQSTLVVITAAKRHLAIVPMSRQQVRIQNDRRYMIISNYLAIIDMQ